MIYGIRSARYFSWKEKTCGWPVNREASTIAVKSDNGQRLTATALSAAMKLKQESSQKSQMPCGMRQYGGCWKPPPTVHNMPKVLSELSGSVCIKYQLIVEDVPSLRQWGKGIEKGISVINENNQNWFTEKELEMLSDALLCQINCINCMKPMAASMDITQIVDDHIKSIQQLHYKVCTYMEDK